MSAADEMRPRVDRRTTLKWLAATMAAAQAGACSRRGKELGDEIPPVEAQPAVPAAAAGYGADPDLSAPAVPWPRTMTAAQLDTAAALSDLILPADERSPAASTLGVPDFIDEWISAPYPQQLEDRAVILAGLAWFEQQSQARYGRAFAGLQGERQAALLESLATGAAQPAAPDAFLDRFRHVVVGAYYTTDPGSADLGYIGNVPIAGEYPGPSTEALEHLDRVLAQLGLERAGR